MIQQTSLNAYTELKAQNKLASSQALVFNALSSNGSMTDRELCDFLGFSDPNKVRPRRKELADMGLVAEDGKRICGVSGKIAISWRVLL